MLTLTIAWRTLLRRKGRMALIAVLVGFGTFLIVFGGMFASSVARESRESIISNFTGDFIIYSDKSKSLPSPFAFTTPLPNVRNAGRIAALLDANDQVESYAMYSQNYGLIQVERSGKKFDLPFIFYAVEPAPYRNVFSNVKMVSGSFFSLPEKGSGGTAASGIIVSRYQNEQYRKNYGVTLVTGESVTLLGITEGGVNTVRSSLSGIFEPVRYRSVFDYINYMDSSTYSGLYNFTGVTGLPDGFNDALAAANVDESSLFALGGNDAFGKLDLASLTAETLILNISAALGAMVVSGILLLFVGGTGLPLPETISQFLIGGGSLKMRLEILPFLAALVTVVVVSVLATIYPVSVATAITPLKAMNDK